MSELGVNSVNQNLDLLTPWLTHTGSLTKKLETLTGEPLLVRPTFEGRVLLSTAMTKQLGGKRARMSAWLRRSELMSPDQEVWIVAESVFIESSLAGPLKRLKNLGKTPLGYVLFGRNKATTTHLIAPFESHTRQNIYSLNLKLILVTETFLPGFTRMLKESKL